MADGQEKYVFISYSRKDSQAVDRISDWLRGAGVSTWRDIEQIKPGDNWELAIVDAVKGASAVFFAVSANSLGSDFVSHEIQVFAERAKIPVIPVMIDGTGINNLPDFLLKYQIANLHTDFERGMLSILGSLEKLGLTAPALPTPARPRLNKGYVFISYAKEDRHHVSRLITFFSERSYAFFDYQGRKRQFEADFDLELEDRIRSAELMVSVVTPNWKKAVWPKKEYLFASKVGTPIYLLQFEDPGPSLLIIDRTSIDCSDDAGMEVLAEQMADRGL